MGQGIYIKSHVFPNPTYPARITYQTCDTQRHSECRTDHCFDTKTPSVNLTAVCRLISKGGGHAGIVPLDITTEFT
jgi:hypothetical protein